VVHDTFLSLALFCYTLLFVRSSTVLRPFQFATVCWDNPNAAVHIAHLIGERTNDDCFTHYFAHIHFAIGIANTIRDSKLHPVYMIEMNQGTVQTNELNCVQ